MLLLVTKLQSSLLTNSILEDDEEEEGRSNEALLTRLAEGAPVPDADPVNDFIYSGDSALL